MSQNQQCILTMMSNQVQIETVVIVVPKDILYVQIDFNPKKVMLEEKLNTKILTWIRQKLAVLHGINILVMIVDVNNFNYYNIKDAKIL